MKIWPRLRSLTIRKQESIFSASLVLGIAFGASAALGLLRNRLLYAAFFSCCASSLDAYNAAFRLPDLIFKLLVSGALSASFIPVFSSCYHRDKNLAYRVGSTVINLLLLALIIFSVVVFIFTPQFSQIIGPGFNPSQISLMVGITRTLLIAQIFFLASNFLTGILHVHQIFIIPALSPIIYNLFVIIGIVALAPAFGLYGVAWGAVVGAFFHLAIQIPIVKKTGFRYSAAVDTGLPGVREIFRLALPRTLSLGLSEIENTVTTFFTTTLASGSLSLLTLAFQLMYLPSRIFSTTVGQASLPILSSNIAKNEIEKFKSTVTRIICQSLFIAIPITTIVLVHRLPLVRIAFGARQFPWSATLLTAKLLAYLTPAIVCQGIIQILIRSFYALHNTKSPLYISIFSLVASILLNCYFITFTSLGVVGLTISASASNLIQCFGLFYFFTRQVHGFGWSQFFQRLSRFFVASVILAFIVRYSTRFMDLFLVDTSRTFYLLVVFITSSLLGLVCYFLLSLAFGIPEAGDYLRYFQKIKHFFWPGKNIY